MSTTGLSVFDETIQKTNIWLKEISEALGSDRHRAYQVLRAVLHCLRDRLIINEAVHLGDQLPMLVRYADSISDHVPCIGKDEKGVARWQIPI
jgi:uncharacterized protein (DUF2267 family)